MAEYNQEFETFTTWCNKASSWLTRHPEYSEYFRAVCYDSKGRNCKSGGDFMRADKEGAFPVYWLWPDQIAKLAFHKETVESIMSEE